MMGSAKIIWVIIFLLVISTIVLVQNLRGKMKGELYGGADGYKIYIMIRI